MDEELLNCVMEICCADKAKAQETLERMFVLENCHTREECAKMIFKYFTLAPPSFRKVKEDIARLAKV
jgi:hypothetical protein